MKGETAGRGSQNSPLTITIFTATPTGGGPIPLNMKFHAEATGGLTPYSDWKIDFGDGIVQSVTNGFGLTAIDVQYTYQIAGTYTVTVIVVNNLNTESASKSLQINATTTPVVITVNTNPTSGKAPLEVTFQTTYTGGNASAYMLNVDFGDGSGFSRPFGQLSDPEYGANFNHIYSKPSTYYAKVCVYDAVLLEGCYPPITITVN
jgi:PKD repeat protein